MAGKLCQTLGGYPKIEQVTKKWDWLIIFLREESHMYWNGG